MERNRTGIMLAMALLAGSALVAPGIEAAATPEFLWGRTEDFGPFETAYDVAVDDWGNTIITSDQSTFAGCNTVKYDKYGNVMWFDSYGSSNHFCKSVAIAKYGTVYVGGNNGADFIIIKYSGGGALGWLSRGEGRGRTRCTTWPPLPTAAWLRSGNSTIRRRAI